MKSKCILVTCELNSKRYSEISSRTKYTEKISERTQERSRRKAMKADIGAVQSSWHLAGALQFIIAESGLIIRMPAVFKELQNLSSLNVVAQRPLYKILSQTVSQRLVGAVFRIR